MWMETRDNGLAATLYGPSTVSALAGGGVSVKLSTSTEYPFGERMVIKVEPANDVAFPLYLRVPGWCKAPQILVNGVKLEPNRDAKGFVRIARKWTRGDVVQLQFPMEPQVLRGYETEFPAANRKYFDFEPAEVFQRRRLPFASVVLGPLLFALPIPDANPNTTAKEAKWQYALDTYASEHDASMTVEHRPMPSHWDWPLNAPVSMTVPARSFNWQPTDAQALPDQAVTGSESEMIRLVPYGCTKFRISMFPVTPRAWPRDSLNR
jgi:uncharacterized protein